MVTKGVITAVFRWILQRPRVSNLQRTDYPTSAFVSKTSKVLDDSPTISQNYTKRAASSNALSRKSDFYHSAALWTNLRQFHLGVKFIYFVDCVTNG